MNYFGAINEKAVPADLVHETGDGNVILGWIDRGRVLPGTPVEEQEVWRLRCLQASVDEAGTGSITRTAYPYGSNLYCFAWNRRLDYDYELLK